MYCPKCGKESVINEMKFCSGCGLQLSEVKEVIDGLPKEENENNSPRRKGIKRSVKSFILGMSLGILGYLFGLTKILLDGRIPANDPTRDLLIPLKYLFLACYFLAPFFVLFGVARIVYALAFEKGRLLEKDSVLKTDSLKSAAQKVQLPAGQSIPVSFWQATTTSELIAPPSVTERTTKLL